MDLFVVLCWASSFFPPPSSAAPFMSSRDKHKMAENVFMKNYYLFIAFRNGGEFISGTRSTQHRNDSSGDDFFLLS